MKSYVQYKFNLDFFKFKNITFINCIRNLNNLLNNDNYQYKFINMFES